MLLKIRSRVNIFKYAFPTNCTNVGNLSNKCILLMSFLFRVYHLYHFSMSASFC